MTAELSAELSGQLAEKSRRKNNKIIDVIDMKNNNFEVSAQHWGAYAPMPHIRNTSGMPRSLLCKQQFNTFSVTGP